MTLPSFEVYGKYSDNYGVHTLKFYCGNVAVWFSYRTPVAFNAGNGTVVRENEWGPTTGKHLNWIDGGNRKARVDGEQFEAMLAAAVNANQAEVA